MRWLSWHDVLVHGPQEQLTAVKLGLRGRSTVNLVWVHQRVQARLVLQLVLRVGVYLGLRVYSV